MQRAFPTRWLRALLLSCLLFGTAIAPAAERLLLEKQSPFGSVFVTEDDDGMRTLRFERYGARQSVVKPGDPAHLELPYSRIVPMAFAFVPEPKSALVIGLGGGTIPSFLRKTHPAMRIDAVDIDPVVVEVARSHFGFREDANLKAHVADGREFVERAAERYDLIFLDGFGADSVPAHLTTREFLSAVRSRLTPGGIVVGNLWGRSVNSKYDAMVKTYRSVFQGIYVVDVVGSGNKMLFAAANAHTASHAELVRRAQTVTTRLRLRNDLGEIADRQMRLPGADGETGQPLTDADRPR